MRVSGIRIRQLRVAVLVKYRDDIIKLWTCLIRYVDPIFNNQTVNDGVAHSKNPRKCAYHVTFDLDLEHILDAGLPGDHRVQVWSRSSHLPARRSDLRKSLQTDGRTDGQTTDPSPLYKLILGMSYKRQRVAVGSRFRKRAFDFYSLGVVRRSHTLAGAAAVYRQFNH